MHFLPHKTLTCGSTSLFAAWTLLYCWVLARSHNLLPSTAVQFGRTACEQQQSDDWTVTRMHTFHFFYCVDVLASQMKNRSIKMRKHELNCTVTGLGNIQYFLQFTAWVRKFWFGYSPTKSIPSSQRSRFGLELLYLYRARNQSLSSQTWCCTGALDHLSLYVVASKVSLAAFTLHFISAHQNIFQANIPKPLCSFASTVKAFVIRSTDRV